MNQLQLFQHEVFGDVLTSKDEQGVPIICATDVARALGYAKPDNAILSHCENMIKQFSHNSGKMQEIIFLYEPDVYRLVAQSKLPTAQEFEKFIGEEVLPKLRMEEYNFMAEPLFTLEGIDRFLEWVEELKRKQKAQAQEQEQPRKSVEEMFLSNGFTVQYTIIDPNNDPE